ncbi:COX assembly mitochondrial protein homolog isoform X2 [Rhynchophorus ferrugineus]|uniref:COX assembly mitochondrial protein n=1 Tax=Rhynchophorus ferrugineus TaxID=354439 RepID=A0A834M636_RHYFE|nr:hypothetical protein GWI33_014002 [Rhynchophorus ferrugineus]
MSENTKSTVLSSKLGGGPHGVGDPNDKSLRRVELDEVADFTQCCKNNNLLMVVKCRAENSKLKDCLTKWYNDEAFKEHCKNLYLEERTQFRSTGIPLKKRLEQNTRIGSNM